MQLYKKKFSSIWFIYIYIYILFMTAFDLHLLTLYTMQDFSYMRQSCRAFWFMQCTVKQSLWPGGWKKRTCLQTVTKQL